VWGVGGVGVWAVWGCESKLVMHNGKKKLYCIFGVYLVTGTKNPDISQGVL
jgi:hypothetical protein